MNKSLVIITSYDGPYGGNFVASLKYLDGKIKSNGYKTVYIFQEKVKDFGWITDVEGFADKVYFLPYHSKLLEDIKGIRKIIKQENAALIYSRMSGWDIAAHLAAPRIPIVWHMEMNPNLKVYKKRLKYYGKYRIISNKNVYSIAVSNPGTESLNSLNLRNKCVAIQNATDFNRLSVKKAPAKSFKAPVNLLVFGYNPYIKGLDLAVKACEKLNETGHKVNLLVSAQVLTYEYVDKRYGENKPDWLELLEPVEDISSVYDKADIILSPSRSEGFPFALLEALYSGMPAVYSDIPGTSWVDEMKSVFKFSSGSIDGLVSSIEDCIKNGISSADQEYNRLIIESKYSMNIWSDKMTRFFMDILNK